VEKPKKKSTKFLEDLQKLRQSGLVVRDGTKPGRVEVFIGGVNPPKKKLPKDSLSN
jgi:hypothetical protein